jgi:hypothetical protein
MSRVVLAVLLLFVLPATALAQIRQNEDVAQFVERRAAEIIKVEGTEKKCPEPEEGEDIIVCATVDNGADQLIFDDQRKTEDSGAGANANAAACVPGTGCRQPPTGGTPFGKRRPPAIPIEEVYKGLPEPENVVPESSTAPE